MSQTPIVIGAVATIEGSRDGIVIEFTLNLVLEDGTWVGK